MNNATYWIVGLIGAGLAVALAVFLVFGGDGASPTAPGTTGPGSTPAGGGAPINVYAPPLENTMSITAQNGGTILTKEFLRDPVTKSDPINPGHYYVGYNNLEDISGAGSSAAPPYVIEYIERTHYFNVALLQEPVATVRQEAEQYLMGRLGINQTDMCRLKYTVSVPYSVSPFYAGTSLGWSFCPGAVQL